MNSRVRARLEALHAGLNEAVREGGKQWNVIDEAQVAIPREDAIALRNVIAAMLKNAAAPEARERQPDGPTNDDPVRGH